MGYYSYITGYLEVSPAIAQDRLDAEGFGDDGERDLLATNEGTPDTVGLVDGKIAVIPGNQTTHAVCRHDESYKAYDIEDSVRALVNLAAPGATWKGALYIDGENSDDNWRIRIEGGNMVSETPTYVWPNGDQGWGA